ncbi:MAG: bifunctional adenosylcobinamide kinase/adenosylcobinamide-phosphate guanylyltransferase [Oscillospiraceae bacterium]
MELILGGAYQGKCAYALALYNLTDSDVADARLDATKKIICSLHTYIYNQLKQGQNPRQEIEKFADENPSTVFICDEIGCGIVPIDPLEREYRDTVGRVCCMLAQKSSRVHRLVCGIPTVIKDA